MLENISNFSQTGCNSCKGDAISDEDIYKASYIVEKKAGSLYKCTLHLIPLVPLAELPGPCVMSTWKVGREFRHLGIPP